MEGERARQIQPGLNQSNKILEQLVPLIGLRSLQWCGNRPLCV